MVADLDSDNGEFHEKPGIAEYDGFDRKGLTEIFTDAGFSDILFGDVTKITKISSITHTLKDFSIFLMTAEKKLN